MDIFSKQLFTITTSIEFLFDEFKKFRNDCDLEIKKEINTLEKKFQSLQATMLIDFMCFCKGKENLEDKAVTKFIEQNEYYKQFNAINGDLVKILFICYNEKPSHNSFYKIFEENNLNNLELFYLISIRREKYTINKLIHQLSYLHLEKDNISCIEQEIDFREKLMNKHYNSGLEYINKCLWATKTERKNAKEAFEQIYLDLINNKDN